jgi:hypothetical protein
VRLQCANRNLISVNGQFVLSWTLVSPLSPLIRKWRSKIFIFTFVLLLLFLLLRQPTCKPYYFFPFFLKMLVEILSIRTEHFPCQQFIFTKRLTVLQKIASLAVFCVLDICAYNILIVRGTQHF